MAHARRVDANHSSIVAALRRLGWHVEDTSHAGYGFPDLVCARAGRLVLIEVKDGTAAPSRRKLTADETLVHMDFLRAGVVVHVIQTVDEAIGL